MHFPHMRALSCIQLYWIQLQTFAGMLWHLSASSVLALSFASDFCKEYYPKELGGNEHIKVSKYIQKVFLFFNLSTNHKL